MQKTLTGQKSCDLKIITLLCKITKKQIVALLKDKNVTRNVQEMVAGVQETSFVYRVGLFKLGRNVFTAVTQNLVYIGNMETI
jgi:hypothetical protein